VKEFAMSDDISRIIVEHHQTLTRLFQLYINRVGLSDQVTPDDLLNDVAVVAMSKADEWVHIHSPLAWLIGIGINQLRKRREKLAKQRQREPFVRDIYHHVEGTMTDGELFDLINLLTGPDPAQTVETKTLVTSWLALLEPEEQHILELAIVYELDGKMLGRELGCSPGTARMRLHRALKRLRAMIGETTHD
jgi:RNA polymerase sigma factor (sigma-70 family)